MKYIGNKLRLLPFIDKVVKEENLPPKGTFCDIFTGTTNVAQFYKKRGYKLITSDIMNYSYVFQYAYIKNDEYPKFEELIRSKKIKSNRQIITTKYDALAFVISYLNTLSGKKGFIFKHYAPGGQYKRQFFSNENAQKIDAVRNEIETWKVAKLINESEYYILLSSLIDAADFVANMSGTYGAYLKIWRSMALKPFTMLVPQLIESNITHEINNRDSNKLIKEIECDILYIDPPYNTRQYAANFHILETLACWDNPKVNGKTGLRPYDSQKSLYSQKTTCNKAFSELIKNADTGYILMSYNNEGIIPDEFIRETLSKRGKVKVYRQTYRRFRTERNHEKRQYKVPDDRVTEQIYFVKI
ncbi:MAG: DNA adenine methylase [Candidatus Omnitrophica bacterium]|nr:DNA adenine methylase [Candidatus Omnitrophota bacterium]